MICTQILLVDDEDHFAEALAKRLASRGMEVSTAGTGEEAMAMAGERPFDLVILGRWLPGMDGDETFDRLREIDPTIRIIFLAGNTVGDGVTSMKKGAFDHTEKTGKFRELLPKIIDASLPRELSSRSRKPGEA